MKPYSLFFSLIFSIFILPSAMATTVLPISLEKLSTRATLIFYGEVITNQVKQDEKSGHIATYTEFKVIDPIKGELGKSHTIKQIGGFLENQNVGMRIHGVPKFQTGNYYVVFLPTKSTLGFSSPLGLHQGSFSVTSINGEQVVTNGRRLNNQPATGQRFNNSQIPLAVSVDKPSQARLDDFVNTVRSYNIQ